MSSPEKGAETPVYVASAPELEGVTGKTFSNKRPSSASQGAKDEADAQRLWDICAQLTHVNA